MDQQKGFAQERAREKRVREQAIKDAAMGGELLVLAPTEEDVPQTSMSIAHRDDPVAGPIVLMQFDPPVPYMVLLPDQAASLGGQLLERAGIVKHMKFEKDKKAAEAANAEAADSNDS